MLEGQLEPWLLKVPFPVLPYSLCAQGPQGLFKRHQDPSRTPGGQAAG